MTLLYILLFVLSFLLTWAYRKYALHRSVLDIPNDRSSHTIPTPRGGGLAIIITWFGGISWLFVKGEIAAPLYYAFLSGIPLVIISFLDDHRSLNPGIRFAFQAISAIGALYFLHGLFLVDLGFASVHLPWLWTPVAFVAILWSINFFNFLDGIDGYIATEIVFIGGALYLLFGDVTAMVMLVTTLGFLLWNWQRAKIFMGDVGSTLLGFNVAVFAIWYQQQEITSVLNFLILTSVFWFDATITLYRRWRNGEKLSEAHRKHAYQRIVQAGFSHQRTVITALLLNLIGLVLVWMSILKPEWVIAFLAVDILILAGVLKMIDRKRPFL